MKWFRLPAWFPSPRSWLRAGLLSFIFIFYLGFIAIIHPLEEDLKKILEVPIEVLLGGGLLLVLFPIPLIAFSVEIYQQLRNFLSSPSPPGKNNRSFLPSLMSWWEGLYGWLVIILSTLVTVLTTILIKSPLNWMYEEVLNQYLRGWFYQAITGLLLLTWLSIAAIFYQIQYLSQKRIERHQLEDFFQESLVEFERPTQPLTIPQPAPRVYKYKRKKIWFKWLKKIKLYPQQIRPLAQKLLLPLLLFLGIMRSYGWVKLSQLYEVVVTPTVVSKSTPTSPLQTSSGIKSEAPLPVPYVPTSAPKSSKIKLQMPPPSLPVDPFQQAVYKATTAANLTQMAESPREWKAIAQQWQDAIDLMKTVPTSNPNYSVAQQKVLEYQQKLQYAQAAASGHSR